MCTITLNNELKGIELSFTSKPEESILSAIKSNGFRWHNVKKVWYAKQSEERIQFANTLKELETGAEQPTIEHNIKPVTKQTANKTVLSLWESTRWIENTSNIQEKLSCKEIAVITRKHLKERFPMCKFSITSDYNKVRIEIMNTPFERDSDYAKSIYNYCDKYLNSYNYCTSYDPYGDYGSSYNFYDYITFSYDYKQTEQTEDIKNDILNYNKQQELFEAEEEERKHAEYEAYKIKQEEDNKAYKIRQQEEARQKEEINNTIDIKKLTEEQKYFVIGSQFARLNKNNTLNEYKEEIKADEFYLQNVEITKEVHFQTAETLEYFSNLLLHDFDFIEGTGGSRTDDYRIQSMTDHCNMDEEERKTVEFYSSDCIAIYYNNQLQFVIDAQGYSYARYVGLCDNVAIQKAYEWDQTLTPEQVEEYKQQAETLEDISFSIITDNNLINTWDNENWNIYKDLVKEELKTCSFKLNKRIIQQLSEDNEKLKVAMYKLLKEVDGIQEQFKNADLQQGQKVTIFNIGGMGGLITSHITIDKIENSSYAQYDKAVKITFKQPRKHGLYYKHYYSDMLVYDGWIDLPQTVLYNQKISNGFTITSTKFSSCDKKAYDAIIDYLLEQNIKPIVNTVKPIL